MNRSISSRWRWAASVSVIGFVILLLIRDISLGSSEAAVLLGAFIGATGSLGTLYLRRRQERRHLRIALRSEILSMASKIDQHAQRLAEERPHPKLRIPTNVIVAEIYSNNSDKIGILSKEEVETVTEFYSQCSIVERRINECADKDRLQFGSAEAFRRDYIKLQNAMKSALREIEANLDLPSEERSTQFEYISTPEETDLDDMYNFIEVEESDSEE